jgi:hypothetical protein
MLTQQQSYHFCRRRVTDIQSISFIFHVKEELALG